jgi:hypothetical protein
VRRIFLLATARLHCLLHPVVEAKQQKAHLTQPADVVVMSIILEGAILPPHHLQNKSASSWPSPYHHRYYPAQGSSPAPMSPQSHQPYISRLPESPLPSQELNSQPSAGWYSPSISAPECHTEVCTSPLLRDRLLICGCLDHLRLIWLYASTRIVGQSLTACIYVSLLCKSCSIHRTVILSNISRHRLLSGLSGTRIYTPIRRAPIRR